MDRPAVLKAELSRPPLPTRTIWSGAPGSHLEQVEDEVQKLVATAKKQHGLVGGDEEAAKEIRLYDYDARVHVRVRGI